MQKQFVWCDNILEGNNLPPFFTEPSGIGNMSFHRFFSKMFFLITFELLWQFTHLGLLLQRDLIQTSSPLHSHLDFSGATLMHKIEVWSFFAWCHYFFSYLAQMDFFFSTDRTTGCWWLFRGRECGLAYSLHHWHQRRNKYYWNHGMYYQEVNLAPCQPTLPQISTHPPESWSCFCTLSPSYRKL